MTPTGLELSNDNTGKRGFQWEGGAESGAQSPICLDLQAIIDAWPSLTEAIKAGILAKVGASRSEK